jgi:epoxide hydrolase-like predicted phosphatase
VAPERDRLVDCVEQCLVPLEPNLELVREVGKSCKVGLVTNNAVDTRSRWQANLPPDLFEVVIDSSEVGLRKPDRAIYELALDRLGVAASAAIFVDDQPIYVEGARSCGLHGVLFENLGQVRQSLIEAGVAI